MFKPQMKKCLLFPYLSFSSANDATEMTDYGDPAFLSPPPATIDGGAIAAYIIVTIVVLVIIGVISRVCARKLRRAIVSELQYAIATAPPVSSNVVQVWQIDAPTMERFLQDLAKEKPVRLTTQQLCNFTRNYSTVLGLGGFGIVYKGQFPNGIKIAVKVLKRSLLDKRAEEQFMAEVSTIGRTYHINLARLFSMLLFEIVGRRRNARVGSTDSLDWFPKHVWDEYEKGELAAMILSNGIEERDRDRAQIMALVALWCVQDSPVARPPMSVVVKMLEGGVEIMPPPKPFHYLFSIGINVLNPPTYTGNSLDYSTSGGTNSYWYNEQTTTIMAKYEIQIASS
ncbi:hypothetical protein Vadar_010812 [Vaccinium darrowii]|uniref:Uncharacterized protein n=1 Tax=Vaccinium darrowii TaxID=229202 RepID=A0ACB7WZU1_9ERIC|nr:hypothetical protein Vadar_010812 [Vaccinium darrowii]